MHFLCKTFKELWGQHAAAVAAWRPSVHVLSTIGRQPSRHTTNVIKTVRARPYGTTSWKATGRRFVSGPKLALWQDRAAFTGQSSLEAKNMKSVR